MESKTTNQLLRKIYNISLRTIHFIKEYQLMLMVLALVIISTYGYELFSFHLTIDEENAANSIGPSISYLPSGRWGLFLFTKLILNNPVIPFLPSALTLLLFVVSAMIILKTLGIQNKTELFLLVLLFVCWSGLAYIISFSTINWLIGIGYLCIATCFVLLCNPSKLIKYLASIPTAIILSIYEPLLVPLVLTLLLHLLYKSNADKKDSFRLCRDFLIVLALGYLVYFCIQRLFFYIFKIEPSLYSSHYFYNSIENLRWYLIKITHLAYNVLVGDSSFYGIAIRSLPIFLLFAGILILVTHYKHREKVGNYILFLSLLVIFTLLPFIGGILTKGYIPYRSLLGVPVFLMGWAALALKYARPSAKLALGILALFTLFQFASSANHLFASSAFAYEEDKLLAYQLVGRIEEEKARTSSPQVQYLEMIGFVERPSTPLVSRIENIGASFFGWDGGHSERVVNFLRVLGYSSPEALPDNLRAEFVTRGMQMPVWPTPGSVLIDGNTLLVKFSPYSRTQIEDICAGNNQSALPEGFCP